MKLVLMSVLLAMAFTLTGCNPEPSSDRIQNVQQEELSKQATMSVGIPSIVNFAEKKHYKDILELRDRDAATITYTRDVNGQLHKICDSVGFGIPYSTQYTNPEKVIGADSYGRVTVPQADPNGLFSPSSSEATWVLCLNPQTKRLSPVYVEDRITVSMFPLIQ